MQFFKNEKNSFRKNALNHLSRDIETGFNALAGFRPNLKKTRKKKQFLKKMTVTLVNCLHLNKIEQFL